MNITATKYFDNRQPHNATGATVSDFANAILIAKMDVRAVLMSEGVPADAIRFTVSISSQSTQQSYVRAEGSTSDAKELV